MNAMQSGLPQRQIGDRPAPVFSFHRSHSHHAWPSSCVGESECRVALVGFGTVGNAVARLLRAREGEHRLRLSHVCNRDIARKKVHWMAPDVVWTDSIGQVVASEADVVVELMGALEPAYELVTLALQSGKSVVTANKQLIAHCGAELLQLARDNGQYLAYGACVAGGVPVLAALQDGLAGDRLVQIRGILNGTCNYILTRIEEAGLAFEDALREAQQAGFAEADPSFDVDGRDAGAKLAILARVGLNVDISPDQVICRSIRGIAPVDFDYAHDLGCTIRQISMATAQNDALYAAVQPCLVSMHSPFAKVSGSQNLVVSTGEFGGETSFGGFGAGGDPTAVAVVSDILQAAAYRAQQAAMPNYAPPARCESCDDFASQHYLRFIVRDRPGIIAALASVLAQHGMNIQAVLQKPDHPGSALPFVITLESAPTSQLELALAEMKRFDFLVEPPLSIPIL